MEEIVVNPYYFSNQNLSFYYDKLDKRWCLIKVIDYKAIRKYGIEKAKIEGKDFDIEAEDFKDIKYHPDGHFIVICHGYGNIRPSHYISKVLYCISLDYI